MLSHVEQYLSDSLRPVNRGKFLQRVSHLLVSGLYGHDQPRTTWNHSVAIWGFLENLVNVDWPVSFGDRQLVKTFKEEFFPLSLNTVVQDRQISLSFGWGGELEIQEGGLSSSYIGTLLRSWLHLVFICFVVIS